MSSALVIAVAAAVLATPLTAAAANPTGTDNPTVLASTGTDEPYREGQWPLDVLHVDAVWPTATGDSIDIAVVDTGVSPLHELPNLTAGLSLLDGDDAQHDPDGHGTQIASVIAAQHDGHGLAGIAPDATIHPYQVHDGITGNAADLAAGIRQAVDDDVDIISVAVIARYADPLLDDAIAHATANDVLVIAAAGNNSASGNPAVHPASHPDVLAVTAITRTGARLPEATIGNFIDLAAPGAAVPAMNADGSISIANGTSIASAHVAGLAALAAESTGLRGQQLRARLIDVATDLGPTGHDDIYGHGVVHADIAAAHIAIAGGNPTAQTIAASRATFGAHSAAHAVIATARTFPDSLAAAPLAGTDGPILLVDPDRDPKPVIDELNRVLAEHATVHIVGGSAAVPTAMDDHLSTNGHTVQRIAGPDRTTTAAAIAETITTTRPDTVLLARADDWGDAITISSWAAATGTPLLVTWPHELADAATTWIHQHQPASITVLGGTAALPDDILNQLPAHIPTHRIAGPTRTDTAQLVLHLWGGSSGPVVLVDHTAPNGWADALSTATRGIPQLYATPTSTPEDLTLNTTAIVTAGPSLTPLGTRLLPAILSGQ